MKEYLMFVGIAERIDRQRKDKTNIKTENDGLVLYLSFCFELILQKLLV